jgi:hypothetical protein
MAASAEWTLEELRQFFLATKDPTTNALVVISHSEHEAHEGDAYKADAVLASITSGQYFAIGFTTPAAEAGRIHLTVGFIAEAAAHIELLEGPTNTPASGAALAAYNRERASVKTTKVTNLRSYDNVGVVGGTAIHDFYSFSDKRQTTAERDEEEWMLAPETAYAVKLTADANGGGQIFLAWSEHP